MIPGLVQHALDEMVKRRLAVREEYGSAVYHRLTAAGRGNEAALLAINPPAATKARKQPLSTNAAGGQGGASASARMGASSSSSAAAVNQPPKLTKGLAKTCLELLGEKGLSQLTRLGLLEKLRDKLGITDAELQKKLRGVTDGSKDEAIKAALGIPAAPASSSPAGNTRKRQAAAAAAAGPQQKQKEKEEEEEEEKKKGGVVIDLLTPVAANTRRQEESPNAWVMGDDGTYHAVRGEQSPGAGGAVGIRRAASAAPAAASYDSPAAKKRRQ